MVFGYVYETGRRQRNEDAMLFRSSLFSDGEVVFAALCDGMGGMEKGAEASLLCIREMELWFDRQLMPLLMRERQSDRKLKKAIRAKGFFLYRQMNQKLFDKMRREKSRMGTTALMCLIYRKRYYLFHIGDSRAYRIKRIWKKTVFKQLTKDHGNERGISRCLGLNREWKPDFLCGSIKSGGILLCTDGFSNQYEQKVWEACLIPDSLQDENGICRRLKELAVFNLRKGETDNISALYVGKGRGEKGRLSDGRRK